MENVLGKLGVFPALHGGTGGVPTGLPPSAGSSSAGGLGATCISNPVNESEYLSVCMLYYYILGVHM